MATSDGLKNNKHRELWHQVTTGKITPDEYDTAIRKHERESMRAMLRANLKKKK